MTRDDVKLAFIWLAWCCMHPFAFAVPLAFGISVVLYWAIVAWEEWRAKR